MIRALEERRVWICGWSQTYINSRVLAIVMAEVRGTMDKQWLEQ